LTHITPAHLYPLTSPQREIWFDQMLHDGIPLYNIGGYVKIPCPINPVLFEQAVNLLVKKHDTLRTMLTEVQDEDGIPMQMYTEQLTVTVPLHDFSTQAQPDEAAMAWMQQQFVEPFELAGQPLFRYDLVKISDKCYYWLLQYHHLIVDGYGVALLNRSLAEIYTSLANEQIPNLNSPSYINFIENDRAYVESEVFNKQRQYWLSKFPTPPEPLFTPRYRSYYTEKLIGSDVQVLYLPRNFYNRLNELAKQHNATLFHLLLGALYVYFTRIAGRDDFAIGLPVLNRANAQFKKTAGLFTGLTPALFDFGKDLTFAELLQRINKTLKANYRHQRFPVSEINRAVGLGTERSQLFDIVLSYESHNHTMCFLDTDGQFVRLLHQDEQTPLTISVQDYHHDVRCDFIYNQAYFNATDIKALQARFVTILEAVLKDSLSPIHTLPVMTHQEIQQLLAWNDTATDYPMDKTIVDLFEEQVEKTPSNIAVVFEEQQLTYQLLNEQANQLAHYLLALKNQASLPDNPLMAIAVERSIEMVIGLLGILKAGGAYVPIDPSYPVARIQYMLEDSQAPVLLTQTHLQTLLPVLTHDCVRVCLDEGEFANLPTVNPSFKRQAGDLAYVIYTSGSTGMPKGVMNTHTGIVNRLLWMQETYQLTYQDRILQKTPFSFDVSVWEFFWPLLTGAGSVVAKPEGHKDAAYLVEVIAQYKVTVLHFVPSMLSAFISHASVIECGSLKRVICSGEALSFELIQQFFNRFLAQTIELHNLYGPTEAAVDVSYWPCRKTETDTLVPIGKPVANTQLYVLDINHQIMPIGVPGELCIGGIQVARGYLNRPELTREKFIEVEIFGKTERLYKTGDLARWLPDGNLEYLGRIDHQIKLRGFRIELGEIEAVLTQHEAVKEAVVILYEADENKRLVAYLTTDLAAHDLGTAVKDWLKARLPDYMVPSQFMVLEQLPLTPNGKIDRKALPEPSIETTTGTQLVTPTQELLASLWADVLKLKAISSDDNFFELGGHSLLATQLIARIREAFEVELPVRAVFEAPSLSQLASIIEAATREIQLPPISAQPASSKKVLSFAQQRLWFLNQFEDQSSATYNMSAALRLEGDLDLNALQQSLYWLIERHQSLRSIFPTLDGQAQVQILPIEKIDILKIYDLTQLSTEAQPLEVQNRANHHAIEPFDLSQGPLFKAELFTLSANDAVLLLNMHHIISDGWSIGVLMKEWQHAYTAFAQDEQPSLPPLSIQYSDYAAWQQEWLTGAVLQQQVDYWRSQLAGVPELLELPTDKPRPREQSYQGAHYAQRLSPTLSQAVKSLSREQGVTLFMTLLSTFEILLSRYARQTDLCVGSPIANRTHSQTENLMGFFVNTLVLRAELQPAVTVIELLRANRQTCLDAYAHQDIPFEMLVEQLQPTRSLSHSPLFQVMLVLQNFTLSESKGNDTTDLTLPGLEITALEPDYPIAKFDLTLSVEVRDEQLYCFWEYATDLFFASTIELLSGHFEMLLTAIVDNPEQAISQLPMLTDQEVQQLLAWNDTATDYPVDKTLVDLFEEQVEKTPSNIAVVFEEQQFTYLKLNEQANQLAHYLLALKNQASLPDNPLIAIAVERSLEMVIGLLGILKAGGAYVPIDPSYPVARIQYMLEDSQAPVLLTQTHLKAQLPVLAHDCVRVCLDDGEFANQPTVNPTFKRQAEDLAYVIYTSGSTGMPKGCQVTHANVARLFASTEAWYQFNQHDVWTLFHSYAFDFSVWEIWGAWFYGAKLVVVPHETSRSPADFYQLLIEQQVTVLNQTPSAFGQLIHWDQQPDKLALRLVIFGGEALDFNQLQPWFARHGEKQPQLVNMYGITETTVHVTYYPLVQQHSYNQSIIGIPLPDLGVWIVDEHNQPLPISVPGEMLVGGAGVTNGYLNRPELTSEKFIEVEIFGKTERIYKTGDLARWLPDGNLEYLGRIDHQIKLRGFRIELGEIEAVLTQHDAVKEAVVILYEADENKRLVAYMTTDLAAHDLGTAVKDWLKARLPDYMVPSQFIVLDKLPLTPNGKIDRHALPEPSIETTTGTQLVTPTQELLASLWAEVLKLNAIHRDDNFFELGGHSLLATQLIARIRDAFEVELPVRAVFEAPKLSQLASQIEETTRDIQLPPISAQPASSKKVLSFAQQRLWFLNQFEDQSSATYNMPAALRLEGNLDLNALQKSLYWLIERHQTLRSTFPTLDGQAQVQILPIEKIDILKIQDLTQLSTEAQPFEVQNRANHHAIEPFDLSQGPLFKAELFTLSANDAVLLLNMHHIISDGWSIGVFIREWQHAYTAFAQGEQPSLPLIEIQYSDYAAWQRSLLTGAVLQQQLDYWREQLAGVPELLELPTDKPRPPQQSYQGAHYKQFLSPALSEAVKRLSREQGVSLFMTLLSTFEILLSRYARQTDLCVGSSIANRTHRQTENLMGFFVNTLVLRAQLQPAVSFLELLQQNRQTCLEAYAHQDIPFEMLVEQLQPTRSLSHSPLFQVMLVLQNFTLSESKGNDTTDLTLPGLEITALEPDYPIAKFDLTLSVEVRDEQLYCFWEYATDLFYLETIERMASHFEMLLTAIVDNPEQAISQLPMLTDQEIQQLLAWNDTATDYPLDKTIVDLFEQQVEKTPSNIAVVFEEQQLTYQQLNEQANQLAHYLLALKNQASLPDNPLIAIAVERSIEMVIGLLGILKAGGAYVPIDPSYPAARIQYMLEDSQAPVLLTQSSMQAQLPVLAHDCVRVCLDDFDFANQPTVNLTLKRQPTDLAYVIYTSGSTGMPKGCQVTHANVARLFASTEAWYQFNQHDVWTLFHSYAFDFSVWEIWGAWFYGAKLVVVPHETSRSPADFYQLLIEQQVTVLNQTPSAFGQLIHWDQQPDKLALRLVIFGGEALDFNQLQPWFARHGEKQPQLVNMYGITETTVHVTYYPLVQQHSYNQSIIGIPLPDLGVWIVDEHNQPLPIGVPGEMLVGGAGVTNGYLNRPELTSEKFIEVEIFGKTERIYKTGDLARWLPDGNLEYLGRIDHQIKLRGFRIELGEIEAVLTQHESVKEAVVILYEAQEVKRLVAYLTTDLAAHDLGTAVKDWLKARLPDYMVPSQFMVLDFVPLTPNGKIDRQALPEPQMETTLGTKPVTPTEELLASLWAEVLKLNAIHRDDNFFELGGHSLLATQLIARIRDAFEVELPVRLLFESPILSDLALWIEQQQRGEVFPPIKPQPETRRESCPMINKLFGYAANLINRQRFIICIMRYGCVVISICQQYTRQCGN
jgi:amino acid adenylation domain-containing protein